MSSRIGSQAGVGVGDLLLAGAPSEVRVHGVALHRAGADDRHLDDEVLEALRPRLRQRLHLGARLDLEHADRVGGLDGPIHLGVVVREAVEVDPPARVALDAFAARRETTPSVRRLSRSIFTRPSCSTSSLSYWVTTRSGMVARSIGTRSMSGVRVTSMPPTWMPRWRGKPSISAQSWRSHCHRFLGRGRRWRCVAGSCRMSPGERIGRTGVRSPKAQIYQSF